MSEPLSASDNVLLHVNPTALILEPNVRTEASLTKQFIASVKENGVLVPIVAIRTETGDFLVRSGQRRTLAAREAGLATVPVYVTNAAADDATRLVEQITENDQRMALSHVDRVVGIQSLLDTGLPVTKVAKRLAVSQERVKHAKAVAGSPVAMDALAAKTATLEEAAGLAEFADDSDAVDRLLRAAGRNYFDHELERLRREREDAARRASAAALWEALGYTVLDGWPQYGSGQVPLRELRRDGEPVDEQAVVDPTHWSVMLTEESVFVDADGNEVDDRTIDWSTEGEPEAEPAEGLVHHDTVTEKLEWVVSGYFCHDPAAAGLTASERYQKMAEVSASLPDGTPRPESSADLERKAAEKAERRKVITMNKAGDAAESVRREFVRTMLKRKTPPKGAMVFVASALMRSGSLLGSHRGDEVASELLGGSVRSGELLDHANDSRAEVVLLGATLGMLESLTPKTAWRGPSADSKAYLLFLRENGYGLSPVEQVVVGEKKADAALEELS